MTIQKTHQRLPLEVLQRWQELGYGHFFHFGISTFDGDEFSEGSLPPDAFCPHLLDVDQWVRVAAEAGARYAVLTAKHVSGFALWPTQCSDYHVGHSPVGEDLVGSFIEACNRHKVLPGLYYCLWDNHHRFGSVTPTDVMKRKGIELASSDNQENPMTILREAFTTDEANEFFLNQISELCRNYGDLFEFWVDIPGVVGRNARQKIYDEVARLQPNAVIMMNNGFGDGSCYPVDYAWPADIMAIERWLPNSSGLFQPVREIEGKQVYLPAEVCDCVGRHWFYTDGDHPRSETELLGMYLTARGRNTNLLLNVPPDRSGIIPQEFADAVVGLRQNLDRLTLGY